MRPPRYGSRSLAEVLPSVGHALGDHTFENALQFPALEQAVVLVVDGMGWEQVQQHRDDLPIIGRALAEQEPIDAAFPTTTPAGLATLTLGAEPGRHGFVGATFYLPDFETVLSPLHWDDDPLPQAVQPDPTVFERMHGVDIRRHGPAKYATSGMTRTLLAGAVAIDHDDFDPSVIERASGRLDYVYLPKLDKLGHVHGANTPKWFKYLQQIDSMVNVMRQTLSRDAAIVITSDHGMVTIPDDRRINVDEAPYAAGVDILAGEPRMRHIYTRVPDQVQALWTQALGDRATVWSREEAIAAGVFGQVDEFLADRIGDVVAVAHDNWVMASQIVDPRPSGLRGLHGGLTTAELLVPALVIGGVA